MSERDSALRAVLVDTARRDARPHPLRTTVLAAVVAFVVGGLVAGGALSAAAAANPAPTPVTTSPGSGFSWALDGAKPVGPIIALRGSGVIRADLGAKPASATGMIVYIRCPGPGTFSVEAGGERQRETCGSHTDNVGFTSTRGRAPTDELARVSATSSDPYTIWVEWIALPPLPEPSVATQAAIADGVVTQQEYEDALSRLVACMTGAGYPIKVVKDTAQGSAFEGTGRVDAGMQPAEQRCAAAEFDPVNKIWTAEAH
jgi:hypothetical protein